MRLPEPAKKTWRDFRVRLRFPESSVEAAPAADSTWKRIVEVRADTTEESTVLLAAHCRIPASAEAQMLFSRTVAKIKTKLRERSTNASANSKGSNASMQEGNSGGAQTQKNNVASTQAERGSDGVIYDTDGSATAALCPGDDMRLELIKTTRMLYKGIYQLVDVYACMPASGYGSGGGGESTPPSYSPEGVSQNDYEALNEKEKELCWKSPTECNGVRRSKNWAMEWSAREEPSGAHNGPQDALRHAAWNARMTWVLGKSSAKEWADAHEYDSQFPMETRMDLHNNRVGRQVGEAVGLGTLQDLEQGLREARAQGRLCTEVGNC